MIASVHDDIEYFVKMWESILLEYQQVKDTQQVNQVTIEEIIKC